jgi:hypothetical protein
VRHIDVEAVDLTALQASFLGDAANVRKMEQLFFFIALASSIEADALSEAALERVGLACEAMVSIGLFDRVLLFHSGLPYAYSLRLLTTLTHLAPFIGGIIFIGAQRGA